MLTWAPWFEAWWRLLLAFVRGGSWRFIRMQQPDGEDFHP
jgi:hypothetical protein